MFLEEQLKDIIIYNRSGVIGECFCLCGAKGFYSCSGQTQKNLEREPVPGKKVWHPPADQSVYLWHVACENCNVFETKSTKVLSDDIRMTG